MADFVFLRFPIFALFAVVVGYSVLSRDPAKTNQRGFFSTTLPLYFLLTAVILFAGSQKDPTYLFMDMYFPVLLHICLYDLLLLLFLPWLRRHFSAKACSALWLLPGALYLLEFYLLRPESPRWLLTIRGNWANYLPYIWLAGFLTVLGWKIADHLLFRRRVLANTHPVMELSALQVWRRVLADAGMAKTSVDLYTSPHVSTPLTLGLIRATARVILPHGVAYRDEDLELILRHEVAHIARQDAWSKFFMVFCTAACWFNPLMWVAMSQCARDLELSCDEAVLEDASAQTRQRYARLLLNTAGSDRGFTTCLSASAQAMRYRLKHVMDPLRRRSGAVLVGLLCFALLVTAGHTALAYGSQSGADLLYLGGEHYYPVQTVSLSGDDGYRISYKTYEYFDPQPLQDYLSTLTFSRMTGDFSPSQEAEHSFFCTYLTAEGSCDLSISDRHATLRLNFSSHSISTAHYYLPDGVDWTCLRAIMEGRATA